MIELILIAIIVVVAIATYFTIRYIHKVVESERKLLALVPKNPMSFYESMKLVRVPIITFKIGNEDINLMLDSGSMISTIDSRVLELFKLPHKKNEKTYNVYGVTGNTESLSSVVMQVEYKGDVYESNFIVQNLESSMDAMKEEYGVRIHGFLGTNFLEKYNYVLDFKEMIAYTKK